MGSILPEIFKAFGLNDSEIRAGLAIFQVLQLLRSVRADIARSQVNEKASGSSSTLSGDEAARSGRATSSLPTVSASANPTRPPFPPPVDVSVPRTTVAPSGVLDKSYKLKIHGTAQKTGTPGHQFRAYREAILEAKKPNVVSVHLAHGYNRGLSLDPKTISPNRRPDMLSVYDNGVVRRVEIQSKTDVPAFLRSRNAALDAQIRAQGYAPTAPVVVRPTTR